MRAHITALGLAATAMRKLSDAIYWCENLLSLIGYPVPGDADG